MKKEDYYKGNTKRKVVDFFIGLVIALIISIIYAFVSFPILILLIATIIVVILKKRMFIGIGITIGAFIFLIIIPGLIYKALSGMPI